MVTLRPHRGLPETRSYPLPLGLTIRPLGLLTWSSPRPRRPEGLLPSPYSLRTSLPTLLLSPRCYILPLSGLHRLPSLSLGHPPHDLRCSLYTLHSCPAPPVPPFPGLLCGLSSPKYQCVSPKQREAGEYPSAQPPGLPESQPLDSAPSHSGKRGGGRPGQTWRPGLHRGSEGGRVGARDGSRPPS